MINFETLDYLTSGNPRQQSIWKILTTHKVFEKLSSFQPILTGTIPINIDIETSDVDIICYSTNKSEFIKHLNDHFSSEKNFNCIEKEIKGNDTILANFQLEAFAIEVFGQNIPSKEQYAYRHMIIEYKLLQQYGEAFRNEIIQLKKEGLKTEPAFAKLLGLKGDPYEALLNYAI